MVGVAQLVERLTVAQNVAGSSPVSHPIFMSSFLLKKSRFDRNRQNTIFPASAEKIGSSTFSDKENRVSSRCINEMEQKVQFL